MNLYMSLLPNWNVEVNFAMKREFAARLLLIILLRQTLHSIWTKTNFFSN